MGSAGSDAYCATVLPARRPLAGEAKGFRSLLNKADSAAWHVAAAKLCKAHGVPAEAVQQGEQDPDTYETRRAAAERLMEAEASGFDRELKKRNPTDAGWLQQVRRAGTTSDKLAAATLLVQVRGWGEAAGRVWARDCRPSLPSVSPASPLWAGALPRFMPHQHSHSQAASPRGSEPPGFSSAASKARPH